MTGCISVIFEYFLIKIWQVLSQQCAEQIPHVGYAVVIVVLVGVVASLGGRRCMVVLEVGRLQGSIERWFFDILSSVWCFCGVIMSILMENMN